MFDFVNNDSVLKLSAENGSISKFTSRGRTLTVPGTRAFRIRILADNGDQLMLDDRDFAEFSCEEKGVLHWRKCSRFPDLEMHLKITAAENGSFRFRPSVSAVPENWLPEFISAPLINVPLTYDLMMPQCEGAVYKYSETPEKSWDEHLPYPGCCNYYPGMFQMQFLTVYSENGGLYLAADDLSHSIKFLGTSHQAGDDFFEAHIECCCGKDDSSADYELPYDMILRPCGGDWQSACEIYRQWVENDPAMISEFPLPEWMSDSPVVVIYPVRGEKSGYDRTNRFIPYENAFPRIMELAEQLDSRIMVLLMRWDHNGAWHPPYYWPPVGGAESFRKFRDLLHGAGHLLGVYGSGTFFTRKSLSNDYSGEEVYQRENLEKAMVRGPHGEIEYNMKPIRLGTSFCITEADGQRIMTEQAMILADEKVDFFQMFDQNLGGVPIICYSREHAHPPVPGSSGPKAMKNFLRKLNTDIRKRGSSMLLGTECAAAGPFAAELPFSDLRSHSVEYGNSSPVPAYQYVFHRRLNNFFGNSCQVPNQTDTACLRFRIARGFSGGSMMSLVLRDSGEIDWGVAACDWSEPAPDQQSIITLIKNLNRTRRRYPEFLRYGDMLPIPQIECGTLEFTQLNGDRRVSEVPGITASAWCAPDGRKAAFFVNYMTEEKSFRLNGRDISIPPLDAVMTALN